jgi:transcription elongation GreA/GreB family factor
LEGVKVGYEAPIAAQLLKKKVGDLTVIDIPAWTMEVEVVSVEPLYPPS